MPRDFPGVCFDLMSVLRLERSRDSAMQRSLLRGRKFFVRDFPDKSLNEPVTSTICRSNQPLALEFDQTGASVLPVEIQDSKSQLRLESFANHRGGAKQFPGSGSKRSKPFLDDATYSTRNLRAKGLRARCNVLSLTNKPAFQDEQRVATGESVNTANQAPIRCSGQDTAQQFTSHLLA